MEHLFVTVLVSMVTLSYSCDPAYTGKTMIQDLAGGNFGVVMDDVAKCSEDVEDFEKLAGCISDIGKSYLMDNTDAIAEWSKRFCSWHPDEFCKKGSTMEIAFYYGLYTSYVMACSNHYPADVCSYYLAGHFCSGREYDQGCSCWYLGGIKDKKHLSSKKSLIPDFNLGTSKRGLIPNSPSSRRAVSTSNDEAQLIDALRKLLNSFK